MPVVDYMTQVELWCIMSFKCALVKKDRPVSRLIWEWRNQLRCVELKWKGVDSACKMVYLCALNETPGLKKSDYSTHIQWKGARQSLASPGREPYTDIPGAVAQVVERSLSMWEVRGSIPRSSIRTLLFISDYNCRWLRSHESHKNHSL